MQRRARRGDGSIEGPEQQPRDSLVSAVTIRVVKWVIAPVAAVKHDSIGAVSYARSDSCVLVAPFRLVIPMAFNSMRKEIYQLNWPPYQIVNKKEAAPVTQRAGQMYVQALFYIT